LVHHRSPLLSAVLILMLAWGVSAHARMIELETYTFDSEGGEPSLPPQLRVAAGELDAYPYAIVQTDGEVTSAWRDQLEQAGARIYGYLPEGAFLVGLDREARARVANLGAMHWIGVFHPAYKLSPRIGSQAFVSPERLADARLQLMVRIFENPSAVSTRIGALGGEVLDYTDDGFSLRFVVRAPASILEDLARIPEVWWVEEQPEFRALNNSTRWVVQSNASGWMPIWYQGIHGEGEIVTLMDTGLDYNSCWFRENGSAPPGPTHRKVINYSLYGGEQYDGCDIGHGSHVAGTVCGDQSYINPGNYNYNGMAYKAKITVQDIGADDWTACDLGLVSAPNSLTAAFNASYTLGARVHTNSWGSSSNSYDSYCVDVDNAMWSHPEFLVCFAAGNAGPDGSTVGSPGTAKNCVTVGATQQAPNQNTIASYSSRGPASDTRKKPTVTAPGGESPTYINSVDNDSGNPPSATCSTQGDPFQGTSMATPAVAGIALDVRQYFHDGFYPGGEPGGDPVLASAALVKAVLVASTDDMGTNDIPNNNEGWGRIFIDRSLFFEGDTRELIAEMVTPGLVTGGTWQYPFSVDGSEELCVTVVWTDYPATSGAGVALINDLDLVVTSPSGTQYRGNVFSAGYSTTGGSADRRNVEECVRIASPASGQWIVTVTGYNVPHGPQPLALVLNGAFANWPPGDFSEVPAGDAALRAASVAIHPNPVPELTRLEYVVPADYVGPVELAIVDVSGRLVRSLVAKGQRGGAYAATWDGLDEAHQAVASGVYFARLTAGSASATCKLIVQR
jgi:hypothetical protein